VELDAAGDDGCRRSVSSDTSLYALTFDGSLRLRSDAPMPRPGDDEALVRVHTAGICNTDIEVTRGYKGFNGILGHEFVGQVVESRSQEWVGLRVCGEINVSCGACLQCVAGLTTHCARREVLGILNRDGAFAEYLVLPVRNLHRVPAELKDDVAVFVEPVAAAYEILEQVYIGAGSTVVVLGDGKLGLLCAQVAAAAGGRVVLLGKHPTKLRLANELGISARCTADSEMDNFDVVIEATGSPNGLRQAILLAAPRGTIVLKSTTATPVEADHSAIVVKELTLVGSRCGPFRRAIAGLEDGSVQVLPLIEERYALSDSIHALQRAAQPGILKVLIDIGTA
jgi:threonine dehydrogenase-like Zn-dependent dehydrogenase